MEGKFSRRLRGSQASDSQSEQRFVNCGDVLLNYASRNVENMTSAFDTFHQALIIRAQGQTGVARNKEVNENGS